MPENIRNLPKADPVLDAAIARLHIRADAAQTACASCAAQERADVLAYWRAQQAKFAALLRYGAFTAEQAAQLNRHYATAQADIAAGRHEGAALVESLTAGPESSHG